MNIRAVIWDLDGTLLDTLGDILACVLRHKHTLVSFR